MRELFYRRENSNGGGYRISAKSDGISAKDAQFVVLKGSVTRLNSVPVPTYKMCLTEDGAIALWRAWLDPHGSRGSDITLGLLTGDDAERAALIKAMPVGRGHADVFARRYAQSDGEAYLSQEPLDKPLRDVLGDDSGNLLIAARLVKDSFHSEALMAEIFSALIDIACGRGARIMAMLMEGVSDGEVSEKGRDLAEALLSFLPGMAAARVGYLSPAQDMRDTSFGLRAVNDANYIRDASVYVLDVAGGKLTRPAGAHSDIYEYARAVARGIADDTLPAVAALRDAVTDWSVMKSDRMDWEIQTRCALKSRADAMTPQEEDALLSWRRESVAAAAKGEGTQAFDAPAWRMVDNWIHEKYLPRAFERRAEWARDKNRRDINNLAGIFEDGQTLFSLNRPEADALGEAFSEKLRSGELCVPGEEKDARDALLLRAGKIARDKSLDRSLYAQAIIVWFREKWLGGEFSGDKAALSAVRAFYARDVITWRACRAVYVGELTKNRRLDAGSDEAFDLDCARDVLNGDTQAFIDIMRRDLLSVDMFGVEGEKKAAWYKMLVTGSHEAQSALRDCAVKSVEKALQGYDESTCVELARELANDPPRGLIAKADKLADGIDARAMINDRLVLITDPNSAFRTYDRDRTAAGIIAAARDRGRSGALSSGLKALDELTDMLSGEADDNTLDAYASMYDSKLYLIPALSGAARKKAACAREDEPDRSKLIRCAMWAYRDGYIDLDEMTRKAAEIGLSDKAIKTLARREADQNALRGAAYLSRELLSRMKKNGDKELAEIPYPGVEQDDRSNDQYDTDDEITVKKNPSRLPYYIGLIASFASFAAGAVGILKLTGLI